MRIFTTSPEGHTIIDPETLLSAYCGGMFPMADGRDGEIRWFAPEMRGIIPLDGLKVSRSLKQTLRKRIFHIRINADVEGTIRACADRKDVWISETIIQSYLNLHRLGFVHSVEAWHDGKLAGGLYGVTIGGAFFGESMFSRVTDASKAALVALVKRMKERGFVLLDTQYTNSHLDTLGCIEIPKEEYLNLLNDAIQRECHFIQE
ncbi:MAG: leucyl/phenylalanyl-tRNA--protein transferase [Bacteroidota bacterium]